MYQGWAARRGMRVLPLAADAGASAFAITGLGAGEILADEAGLHVFEQFGEESRRSPHVARVAVRVHVATWTPSAADAGVPLDVLAARAFAGEPAQDEKIVRQYRFGQSPFVRDATRGYRTGKLDRVLVGDFDLF